jgi:hypothetical protein
MGGHVVDKVLISLIRKVMYAMPFNKWHYLFRIDGGLYRNVIDSRQTE